MVAMTCTTYSLMGWLDWEGGCLMWLWRRYRLLRLLVNLNMPMLSDFVCSIARSKL